jgi:Fur family peroxide stress response transcriptional regulator
MNTKTRFEEIVEKFREQEFRMTPQRMAIIKILCTSPEHLSASELHEQIKAQFPTTSLATIYKTLTVLKEMGQVIEISFGSDKDSHFDGLEPTPHPHLICIRCEKIVDAELDDAQHLIESDLVKVIGERTGYQVTNHRFDIYGLCPTCQTAG